jgi:ABC-2 type transport system ATP-binding protein
VNEPLLVAENLTKVFYGTRFRRGGRGGVAAKGMCAVDGLNLAVFPGDVFGFLGPNGAGKSTTIRMILGLIHPTEGRVSIGGHDLATERLAALRKVGAFVEAPSFYQYLTGRQNLEIFSGLSGGVSPEELDRVVELVGLRGRENDKVSFYSHGMRQRLGIAACLLPMPELLVLDEPTDGLDPHGIHETRELIKRLAREEKLTIFLSSHLLGEVENLCNRIAILEKGTVILQGALNELEREHRHMVVRVDRPEEAAELLRQSLGLQPELRDGAVWLAPGTDARRVNAALVRADFNVESLALETAWLDRLFLEKTTSKEPAVNHAPTTHPPLPPLIKGGRTDVA